MVEYAQGDCLDVGCGDGYILKLIAKKLPNKKHIGVDYNPEIKDKSKARNRGNVKFVFGDVRKIRIMQKFDTIILSHVLEHMTDPAGLLLNLREKLKPGGNFVIVVPNKNGFMNSAEGIEEGWGKVSIHYWKFDIESLAFLLKQLGFSYEIVPTSMRIPFSGRICRKFEFLFDLFYLVSVILAKLSKNRAYELFFIVKPKKLVEK